MEVRKKILFIIILFVVNISYSQKKFLGIGFSYVIPVGLFRSEISKKNNNDRITTPNGGYANNGYTISVQFGKHISKKVSLVCNISYVNVPVHQNISISYVDQYEGKNAVTSTINNKPNNYNLLFYGLNIRRRIKGFKNYDFFPFIGVGLIYGRVGDHTAKVIEDVNQFKQDTLYLNYKNTKIKPSIPINIGFSLERSLSKSFFLSFDLKYILAESKFENDVESTKSNFLDKSNFKINRSMNFLSIGFSLNYLLIKKETD